MNIGDYAIVKTEGKKKTLLFKISGVSKGIVSGVLVKNSHIPNSKSVIEVPIKDIILNLGKEPYPGSIYGCDTSALYLGKKQHIYFGPLYFFYKPASEQAEKLISAFDKVYKTLKQNRLEFLIQPDICIWEIMPAQGGKYAGMYRRSKNPDKYPHRLQISPELMPSNEWAYVILHELMHHLHFEFITSKKLNASWIQLFNTSIKELTIRKDKSIELLESLLKQQDAPSDFKSNLDVEDTLMYKWILRTIQQNHGLSVKELDILFETECFEDIRSVWPSRTISKKELKPVISEYACHSFKELLAEAGSFLLSGKKLPKNVMNLLDKTFSYARMSYQKNSD